MIATEIRQFAWGGPFAAARRMNSDANTVYVLTSQRHVGRYYTGITSDMARRLAFHNAGESRHTASGCPWRVVATITVADPTRAGEFEMYLKTGSGRAFAARHFR
jgi:predicted GIY-YIG superfamily endonuclease